MSRVIIVGGSAAGASAAARLRRLSEETEITIFEKGGYVSFANCGLPYYLGGEIQLWSSLQVTSPDKLRSRFNLNVHTSTEVVSIDRAAKKVIVREVASGVEATHEYDDLVLTMGCDALMPPIPGIDRAGHFALRSLEDTGAIEAWMATKHPNRVVVCGGGFIGLEFAEQMKIKGIPEVHVVELAPQVMAPLDHEMAQYLHEELRAKGIKLHLSDGVAAFQEGADGKGPKAAASDVVLKSGVTMQADLVVLSMGIRPCTKLAKEAGLELAPTGHVKVDERMLTSDEHIYAAGDAVEVRNRSLGGDSMWAVALGGPANRQGRVCADQIAKTPSPSVYKGTIGASVVKIFDLTAASVGVNERTLKQKGLEYKAVYNHATQHAGYYPNALPIHFKLLFNPTSGMIYGGQAVGKDGVEKRVDVLSTAMQGGMKANELADLELCYAPPYGSARDPINQAGMIAGNIMAGLMDTVTPMELAEMEKAGKTVTLVDVREPSEVEGGALALYAGSQVFCPLGELRERLPALVAEGKLVKGAEVVVACKSGQRAHVGARMLRLSGFPDAKILTGSFLTAQVFASIAKEN